MNELKIDKLFPYTKYHLIIFRSRNGNRQILNSFNFATNAYYPNRIEPMEITSKNTTSVSLRWKPPFPPNGELERFYLNLYCPNYLNEKKNITINEPCLWSPVYHCGSILVTGNNCSIELLAKNKGLSESVISEIKGIDAVVEAPKPPEKITYEWKDNNDLLVRWNHPNNTNGLLKRFEIVINATSFNYYLDSDNEYKLKYYYLIKETQLNLKWCDEEKIRIRAQNEGPFFSSFQERLLKTPPKISNNMTISVLNQTTTAIKISIDYEKIIPSFQEEMLMFILVSEDKPINILENFEQKYKEDKLKELKEIQYQSNENVRKFEIGNNQSSPLTPGTNYSVVVIFVNKCKNKQEVKFRNQSMFVCTLREDGQNICGNQENAGNELYALILLCFIPAIVIGYWYIKKKHFNEDTDKIPLNEKNGLKKRKPVPGAKKSPKRISQILTTHSKLVRITDLEEYVEESIKTGELERQHNLFSRGLIYPHEYGSLPQNLPKNRYKNLVAYDHTRVTLQKISNDEFSDYINANYIDGYKVPRVYIATQGPKKNTLNDFWRMIWQENVQNIIMLANIVENGKKKVEKYWPDINEEVTFANIKIKFVSSEVFANFEYRKFSIHYGTSERQLRQLHFTTWPDHGVPMYSESMVVFLQRILKIPYNSASPIVVHCSAGVGRTGTVILSDICLRMAAGDGSVNFLAHLELLRNQRANLVDNIEQYKLVHLVVLECLFGRRTAIPCNEHIQEAIQNRLDNDCIESEMNYINNVMWQDSAMETIFDKPKGPIYLEKNRFGNIQPGNYRVFLPYYPVSDQSSTYINAVKVDGFRTQYAYIVTQQPMPNTLGDFWRMIVEEECTVIISLNDILAEDKTICQFWPEENSEIKPVDYIKVRYISTNISSIFEIITVLVENSKEDYKFYLKIIHLKKWKPNDVLPGSISNFLSFIEETEPLLRNVQPIVVTCYDGATASGLYIALRFVLDKVKLEHECDVCQAVRSIRHFRKQFVTNGDQYKFLFEAALNYITSYESYSNFN